MSGYPDDRPDTPRRPDPRELEQARTSVQAPGILLVVVGVLSLAAAVYGLIRLPQLPAQLDQAMADIDADPRVPQDQKDRWRSFLTTFKEVMEHPAAVAGHVIGIVASLVVVLGGVRLMTLSGTALPVTASVLAMIPCTVGFCCLLGFPAGVWALVVLNRPEVRAAVAARRAGAPPADPDARYLR